MCVCVCVRACDWYESLRVLYHSSLNTEPCISLFYHPIWPPSRRYVSRDNFNPQIIITVYSAVVVCQLHYSRRSNMYVLLIIMNFVKRNYVG